MSYKDIMYQADRPVNSKLELEATVIPRGVELIVSMASLYQGYNVYGSMSFPATDKGLLLIGQWLKANEDLLSKESFSRIKSYLAQKKELD